jgi:hypothetical protein
VKPELVSADQSAQIKSPCVHRDDCSRLPGLSKPCLSVRILQSLCQPKTGYLAPVCGGDCTDVVQIGQCADKPAHKAGRMEILHAVNAFLGIIGSH